MKRKKMTRSIFGWSYPPGCSGPPEGPDPSELEEKIYGLLEEAGISQEYLDKICNLIEDAESDREWRRENGLTLKDEETGEYYVMPLSHVDEWAQHQYENALGAYR